MRLPSALLGRRTSKRDKVVSGEDEPRKRYGDSSRGMYEPVEPTSGARWKNLPQVVPMVSLLLAGIALILTHHLFYAYLDSKIIDAAASDLPRILRDQTTPFIVGTVIAHGARLVLSMVVNATFAQLFWETLRSRRHSTREIDALVQCGRNLFHPSAMRTLFTAPILLLVSLVAAGTSAVVILSPGSLSVSPTFLRSDTCVVPTAPNLTEIKFDGNSPAFIPEKIQATGTYLPPFRANVCAIGTSSCSYNVSFWGPVFKCLDISNQTDFASSLNSSYTDANAPYVIWNGTQPFPYLTTSVLEADSGVWNGAQPSQYPVISVSTWDLENNVKQANNCTVYQATYQAEVTLDQTSISAEVWDVVVESTGYSGNDSLMDAYLGYSLNCLTGYILAGPNGFLQEPNGPDSLSSSRFFITAASGNHTWIDNMTNVLTSFMQNVSLSLLSGSIGIGDRDGGASLNLLYVNSSCVSTWDAYVYSPVRLLSTYGVAFVLSLCIAIPGMSLILRNGVEEKILVSHIIRSALNPWFFHNPKDTIRMTQTHTSQRSLEHPGNVSLTEDDLILDYDLQSKDDETDLSDRLSSNSLSKSTSTWRRLRSGLQASTGQLIFLTSSGTLCMLLHHFYYTFLGGTLMSSQASRHHWTKNGRIARDIGVVIAYIGQICLSTAIGISSHQLFWNILRRQAHRISQVNSMMRIQQNPFSISLFRCSRASISVVVAAFICASLPLVSTFAPNSIKLAFNQLKSTECTIRTPRNLTSLQTSNLSDYSIPVYEVFASGTYMPPANLCNANLGLQCSYGIEFLGPGLHCRNVTGNYTAFNDANLLNEPYPHAAVNTWLSSIAGDDNNRTMRIYVQALDVEGTVYQATYCAGVMRSYSVVVTHDISSTIEVTRSNVLSPVLVNPGANLSINSTFNALNITPSNVTFMQQYLLNIMNMVEGADVIGAPPIYNVEGLFQFPNILASTTNDQELRWNVNLDRILEQFAQNATLSLLSGQIFLLNSSDGQELLEDFRTTCDYVITAYEYSPSRLFATYGIAIALTILCAMGGVYAIRRNGVDESMDFSRFLRAVSNERMFNSRERIEMETAIKADNDPEGGFAPVLESDI